MSLLLSLRLQLGLKSFFVMQGEWYSETHNNKYTCTNKIFVYNFTSMKNQN